MPEPEAPARPQDPSRLAPFYENLEALRGICAVLVVLYHVEFASPLNHNVVVRHGWLFVDFFFVLSGFVIALIHVRAPAGWNAAKRFLTRRFFRLYPLHLASVLFVAALLAVRVGLHPASATTLGIDTQFRWLFLANLAMVHAWGFTDRSVLNVPSWSISTEWVAYLITAAIFGLTARPRWRVAGLAAIGLVALLILASAGGPVMDGPLLYRVPRCLYGFALGAAVFALTRCSPVRGSGPALLVQLIAIAGIVTLLTVLERAPRLELGFPPLAALLVIGAVADHDSPLFRLLTTAPAQLLGRLSYSIYLVHLPILMVANFVAERLVGITPDGHAAFSPPLAVLATVAVLGSIILVSLATHRWIEVPWREHGRRITVRIPT